METYKGGVKPKLDTTMSSKFSIHVRKLTVFLMLEVLLPLSSPTNVHPIPLQ